MPDTLPAETQESSPPQAPKAPAGRPAAEVLERLFELHPALFGAHFRPLKLGAFQDLMARHPGEFTKDELKAALGVHARSTRYLQAVANGERRHDLDGEPLEPVAPEHVFHAIAELYRRRAQRGKADASSLAKQLVRAIDTSGLSREAYLELVKPSGDAVIAALDEAFAFIGHRAAKREALRRAFESSGQTVEAFAEMYGLDPRTARQDLGVAG